MAIRILHVGTGSRGRHWVEIVRDYPDAASVAFVDKDPKALDEALRLRGQSGVSSHTNLSVALRDVEADVALITSPSFLHTEHALQCLEAGLTVLIEKPFATTLADASQVIRKARAAGKHVIIAENYRFYAAERTMGQWLAAGRLGEIVTVVCVDQRNQPPSEQGPWVRTMDYPQLMEIAVHHFDSFRYLFGRNAVSVSARIFNPASSLYRSGAATEALIEMDGNLHVTYFGTLVGHRYEYSLLIDGERGSLWTDRKRVWWRKKSWPVFVPVKLVPVAKGDELPYPRAGTTSLLNQVRDAILQNKEAETSGRDNFSTLAMVAAVARSAEEGRSIAISELIAAATPETADVFEPRGQAHVAEAPRLNGVPVISGRRRGSKPRTLVIGWDAADADLIEQWCAQGVLPNIARMKAQGTWARLETTAAMVHVSAWPSIFTGTTPDKHGLYHAYVARPGEQGAVRPQPDRTLFPFIWKLLSDHGKCCVLLDAFLTCPLQGFNGSQIVDWGSWSHFWETAILPETLKREWEKRFGRYPAEDHSKVGMGPPSDLYGFHQRLLAGVAKKTAAVKWLIEREDWDFFLTVFAESHPSGHYFWQFHDSSYPGQPQQRPEALRHALLEIHMALDRALGEIFESVDDATTVFLVSGDGMGPNYSGSHILPDLLTRMKLFNGNHSNSSGSDDWSHTPKPDLLSTLRNMVPERLRIAITKTLLPRSIQEKLSLRWKTACIAWNWTRAFLIENSNEGYVRINLKGREPQGIVEAGKEYRDLCDEIYQTFKTMTNPANGALAARTVYKTDDIYDGPCRSHMPDIIIHWNDDAKIATELLTAKYGMAHSNEPAFAVAPYYTGNHRPNAFMISIGPGIFPGEICEGRSILDLAPTILNQFGIDPPDYMDGRILTELRGRDANLETVETRR